MIPHLPQRPLWTCQECGQAWPCPTAREAMTQRMSVTYRHQYMAGYFAEAAEDLPGAPIAHLWDRFVGWIQ